jgi:hypothetical protein
MFIARQTRMVDIADFVLLWERSVVAVQVTYGYAGGQIVDIDLTIHGPLKQPIPTQH